MSSIPQEEQDALVKRIWENSREKIEESVRYALFQELSFTGRSALKKMLTAELEPLVRKVVSDHRDRIEQSMVTMESRILDRSLEQFEMSMKYDMQSALSDAVRQPLERLGKTLSIKMWQIADKIIDEEREARLASTKGEGTKP